MKSEIVEWLGQSDLRLPQLIAEGLAANPSESAFEHPAGMCPACARPTWHAAAQIPEGESVDSEDALAAATRMADD